MKEISPKIFTKGKWFFLLIIFFTILNLALSIFNLSQLRKRGPNNSKLINQTALSITESSKFINESSSYDSISPDFIARSINGQKIKLSQLVGKLIILRFSRFYLQDLPNLLYLEYLAKRYGDFGVELIFINTLGKHFQRSLNNIITLSSPIIEDDGLIASQFNAGPEETIIIDKFFKIKLKLNYADRRMVFDQVMRHIQNNSSQPVNLSEVVLADLVKKLTFHNVINNKLEQISYKLGEAKVIINFYISTCFGCPEGKRLALLKELAEKLNQQEAQIILLFGKGNGQQIVKEYLVRTGLDKTPIVIGIIEENNILTDEEYSKIFQYDVDPRLLIFKKGGILIFTEKIQDENNINEEFLLKILQ